MARRITLLSFARTTNEVALLRLRTLTPGSELRNYQIHTGFIRDSYASPVAF